MSCPFVEAWGEAVVVRGRVPQRAYGAAAGCWAPVVNVPLRILDCGIMFWDLTGRLFGPCVKVLLDGADRGVLHTPSKAERKSSRRTQHTLTVGHTHCAIMSISYHGLTPCERGPGGSSVLGGLRHATSSPVTASAEDAAASSAAPHRPWPAAYTSLHEERRLGRPLRHAIVRVCPATILVRVRQVLVCGREPRTTWL